MLLQNDPIPDRPRRFSCSELPLHDVPNIHAAPFVSWLILPAAHFRYASGSASVLRSSDRGTRYFCPSCGTHIACINDSHPAIIDVAVGSLDRPDAIVPKLDAHTDTRLPWLRG